MNDSIYVKHGNYWCDICGDDVRHVIRLADGENVIYLCKSCAACIAALIPELDEKLPSPLIGEFFD